MPPPPGASGMLYRTVIALAASGRVNSTCWPGASWTALRPEASAGSVYASRLGPMTVPLVAAFSASCSAKATLAPRPATRAGSSPARVTAGAGPAGVVPANAVPAPPTMLTTTAAAAVEARPTSTQRRRAAGWFLLRDIGCLVSLGT